VGFFLPEWAFSHNLEIFMKLTIYYLVKFLLVASYTYIIVFLFHYSLMPLITLYGFWPFIGTITFMSFAAFIISAAFFFIPKPKSPQATHRHPDLTKETQS